MRRWNGWADEGEEVALPEGAASMLEALVGPGRRGRDATLDEVAAAVPPSRLPPHALATDDPVDRIRHARGQSLPDWIALRSGRLGALPDAVARPSSAAEVREILAWSGSAGATVIPYGGGTSVVGGLTPADDGRSVVTVALERLAGIRGLDRRSGLATFGAGTVGPDLEAALAPHGLTLGHSPQSFERSTVGGWVVTRSAGYQSLGVGRIEALFAGGRLEAPAGTDLVAGRPDPRAGSEGSDHRLRRRPHPGPRLPGDPRGPRLRAPGGRREERSPDEDADPGDSGVGRWVAVAGRGPADGRRVRPSGRPAAHP